MIDDGQLVERLRELGLLLVDALEELEAGRCENTRELLVEIGDKVQALHALAFTERRLVGKVTSLLLDLIELGEGRPR